MESVLTQILISESKSMIVQLKKKYEYKKAKQSEWCSFWCLRPRIINNHLLWLHRAERRITGMRYDGASGLEYPVYEYRLIDWYIV